MLIRNPDDVFPILLSLTVDVKVITNMNRKLHIVTCMQLFEIDDVLRHDSSIPCLETVCFVLFPTQFLHLNTK